MISSAFTFVAVLLAQLAAAIPDTDILVIGGGTSGCVLAARLCANLPNLHITVVERGQPRSEAADFIVRAPLNTLTSIGNPELFETFQSEPEPTLGNRVFPIFEAATLGGASAINGMQWGAPLLGDVDRWGVAGLSEKNAELFYRRAFEQVGFAPLRADSRELYTDDILNAGNRAGFVSDDGPFDRKVRRSIFANRHAINSTSVRQDSCTAYLTPVQNGVCSRNLRVVQGITVTRVLFTREGYRRKLRAYGAEYVYTNDTSASNRMVLNVRKRIISSAGAFNSPKLLQLSGIGPRSVLRQAGIPVLKDVAVGTHAQAQPLLGIISSYDEQIPLEPLNNDSFARSEESIARWRMGNGGPLGGVAGAVNARAGRDGYSVSTFIVLSSLLPPAAQNMTRLFGSFCLENAVSRGWVQVRDRNPFTPPKVQLGMLSTIKDVVRMARCLRGMANIHKHFDSQFGMRILLPPGGEISVEYIREVSSFAFHHVGGCGVGKALDRRLKVRGTTNLYVVDASSLRTMTSSAGPMASVYMLAEFVAQQFTNELGWQT